MSLTSLFFAITSALLITGAIFGLVAFAALQCWTWFMVPLGFPAINYWAALGIVGFISLTPRVTLIEIK